MQEKTKQEKSKTIIDNGKSHKALKTLVNELISDVRFNPEALIKVKDGYVEISNDRFEIYWRTRKGALKSIEKAKTMVENIEDGLTDASLVAKKTAGKIQGQLVLELIDDKEGEEPQCRLIGWFCNKKKNWVPKLLVSKSFVGEKKVFFGKGFSFTVFVK